jgi:hypothetical protein
MLPNYQNAKIYKIYCDENDEVYYGSTVQELNRRICRHRSHLKSYKEGKGNYISSFKILELTSSKIELVENYPCNSKKELLEREGYYIKNNNCINQHIPNRSVKEWFQDNKNKVKEQRKLFYETNKDRINKERREKRKEQKNKV